MPPRRWPDPVVRQRVGAVERIWKDLSLTERDQRLSETRRPDPGFTAAIHAWAEGDDLAEILEDEEMTGGDFVRNVKQVIDLLRQLAEVAPEPETAATARVAADRCRRGVVAASSTVTDPRAVIRPGEPWGSPDGVARPTSRSTAATPALAAAVAGAPGALVRFRPDATSDLARAVGLAPSVPRRRRPSRTAWRSRSTCSRWATRAATNMCVLRRGARPVALDEPVVARSTSSSTAGRGSPAAPRPSSWPPGSSSGALDLVPARPSG